MTRRRPAPSLLAFAFAAAVVAGCGASSVLIDDGGLPDQPSGSERVGPATVVAQGTGEAGEYRAWVYRDVEGLTCFELATPGMAATGCSTDDHGATDIAPYDVPGGWFVAGGTRQPATVAVLRTAAGGERRASVVAAPGGATPGIRYVVIGVEGETPETLDLLGDDGTVLETVAVAPN